MAVNHCGPILQKFSSNDQNYYCLDLQVLKGAMTACAELTKGKLSDEDFKRAK